jgi:hypothetical protein
MITNDYKNFRFLSARFTGGLGLRISLFGVSWQLVVHLRDINQTFGTSPTPENTSIASPVRVKGVPAKAFKRILKAPLASPA